jgi:hypothetical protein
MINKGNLTEEQQRRYTEIINEMILDFEIGSSHPEDPNYIDLYSEIIDLGMDMIALLKVYKEQLKKEGKLPLSEHMQEVEDMDIMISSIDTALIDLLPKGIVKSRIIQNE